MTLKRRRVIVESDGHDGWWRVLVQDEIGEGSEFWQAGVFREREDAERLARRCRQILRLCYEPKEVLARMGR